MFVEGVGVVAQGGKSYERVEDGKERTLMKNEQF